MAIVFLLFPVVFSLLIGLTFGGGGDDTMAPIALAMVDEDGGLAGRFIASAFTRGEGPVRFEVQSLDLASAMERIEKNKVSAVLRIPPGFTDSLLASRPARLEVVKNPAQGIYPGIVEEYASVLALLGSSASRILGEPLREIRDASRGANAPADALIARTSVAINQRMRGIARYALPPAIRLEKPAAPEGGDDGSKARGTPLAIALFVLPGMATFSLLTLAMTSMGDLRREEELGTLARQFTSPLPAGIPVLGKAIATCLLALLCILVLSVVAAVLSRSGASLFGFIVLSIAFALAATGFATLMHSLFQSERAGTALGAIVLMVMAMFGGSFIPLNSLPAVMRGLAPFTLNYWANEGYREILFEGAGIAALLPNLAVLVTLAAVFSLVALGRIRRRFLRGV